MVSTRGRGQSGPSPTDLQTTEASWWTRKIGFGICMTDQMVNDPMFGSRWREAIGQELRNLMRFGTWEFVRRPEGRPVVSCKWVFNVKYGHDGRIERFKARLVARGFSQSKGLDFEDTFPPVIRLETLRTLFAIAAVYGLKGHLLDADNAFVGSNLDTRGICSIGGQYHSIISYVKSDK